VTRVLILRVGAMGDVLHALPAIAALRRARPDWPIDWVVDERWQPLLTADSPGPEVRASLPVPIKAWKQHPFSNATLRSLLSFKKLRGDYDIAVDMQGTLRSALIGRLAGGGLLNGYADPRESFARTLYGLVHQRRGTHVVDQGAALLGDACDLSLTPAAPQLPHTPWADDWAADLIAERKVVVLTPRAGWAAKQWPPERYGLLAHRLRDQGYTCIVNAPFANDPVAAAVIAASHGAAEVTICDVAGLVALVRRAQLLVGGDTGPMHLAATLSIPTVALFGPTSPARNGPWGPGPSITLRDPASPDTYKRNSTLDPGLANITVEQVLSAICELTPAP
jgi:heptosyltransferase-1